MKPYKRRLLDKYYNLLVDIEDLFSWLENLVNKHRRDIDKILWNKEG